jgi:predicted deacetylase
MAHLLLPHHMHAMLLEQDEKFVMWMTNQTSHDKEPLINHNMPKT